MSSKRAKGNIRAETASQAWSKGRKWPICSNRRQPSREPP